MNGNHDIRNAVVAAGGETGPGFAKRILDGHPGAFIAAADAGLAALDEAGFCPDLLVGDFDTVDPSVLSQYINCERVSVRKLNPVKDASDLEFTLDMLLQKGCRNAWVIGALGGRADHAFCNILLTYYYATKGMTVVLLDEQNRIRCIPEGPFRLAKEEQWGKYISLFAAGGRINGLSLQGFRYPLEDFTMDATTSPSLTVSNELISEEGMIDFEKSGNAGIILMETADRTGKRE